MNNSQDRDAVRGDLVDDSVRSDKEFTDRIVWDFRDMLTSFGVFGERRGCILDLLDPHSSVRERVSCDVISR